MSENTCQHCGQPVHWAHKTEHGFGGFVHDANDLTECPTTVAKACEAHDRVEIVEDTHAAEAWLISESGNLREANLGTWLGTGVGWVNDGEDGTEGEDTDDRREWHRRVIRLARYLLAEPDAVGLCW